MRSRRYGSSDAEGCDVLGITTVATLSIMVAAVVFGGDEEEEPPQVVADCVIAQQHPDGTYQVVDDRFCGSGGSHVAYYQWLYGSSGTGRAGYVRGGTTVKPADAQITTRTGRVIQRGGFGGSGRGGGG